MKSWLRHGLGFPQFRAQDLGFSKGLRFWLGMWDGPSGEMISVEKFSIARSLFVRSVYRKPYFELLHDLGAVQANLPPTKSVHEGYKGNGIKGRRNGFPKLGVPFCELLK